MEISKKDWNNYIKILRKLQDKAALEMLKFIEEQRLLNLPEKEFRRALIDYAQALVTKYGEGATAAACDIYDAVADMQNAHIKASMPAETATYQETATAVNGTLKTGNDQIVADSVGRLVKVAGVDTILQNALRDGAEWAWIPQGLTCPFCIMLASQGWQRASKDAIKNGHAQHIHANCDCTYAVRFNSNLDVEGYNDGKKFKKMYKNAPLDHWNTPDGKPPAGHEGAEKPTSKNRLNAMRRQFYSQNGAEEINVNI